MGILILILILAVIVFVSIKISNLKYRARQHLLKNTGFNQSAINSQIYGGMEKKNLEKFVQEHTEYTEESIKELFKNYCAQLFNRNVISEFSESVAEKIQKDSKLDNMLNMEYQRTNILGYTGAKINTLNIYTDGKDEYNVYLYCTIADNKIQVDRYLISKGVAVGF